MLRFARDTVGYSRQLFERYGKLVSLASGGGTQLMSPYPDCPGTVLAYGPEMVRDVATQHEIYHKVPLSGRLHPLGEVPPRQQPLKNFASGLFGVNSDEHRRQRRMMMPAFQKQRIDSYRDDMVRITDLALADWQPGQVRNIAETMQDVTKRIATKTLFGEDIGPGGRGTGQMLQDSLKLLASPMTRLFPYDLPGTNFRKLLGVAKQLQETMREIVARKQATGTDDGDVLSMLIRASKDEGEHGLTDDELLAHTGILFAAGHETSANSLTWTLFLLSQHPDVLSDLVDEIHGVLDGDAPTVDHLQRLPLLEHVVKESMRVIPAVPWNGRVTSQATELGGHPLPAGTEVMVSIYETHHMRDLYAEPEAFRPRRWETINPSAYEYNPFSAGPRMCIGATFAMLEIKIILAMLLQRFRLEFVPGQVIDRTGQIVLAPRHGVRMKLHAQDRNFRQGVGGVAGNVRDMVQLP